MSSPASDIAQLLAENSVGDFAGVAGWAIYVGKEPSAPDDVLTVYDTGGSSADDENGLYYPSIQIRVRSNSYLSAYAKAEEVRAVLTGLPSFVADGVEYVGAWQSSDIACIGFDDNDRALFVINYRLMREQ